MTIPVDAGNNELPLMVMFCDADPAQTVAVPKLIAAVDEAYRAPVRAVTATTPNKPVPPATVVTTMLLTLLLRSVSVTFLS